MSTGELIKMPLFLQHMIWAIFGLSGYSIMSSGGTPPDSIVWFTIITLIEGFFVACGWYGLVSLIRDYKKGGGKIKELISKIKQTHRDAFKKTRKK